MEELYAEFLLWYAGCFSKERYNKLLDEKFMNESDSDLYLELEDLSSNLLDSLSRLDRYWNYECEEFDEDLFGIRLFSGLKIAYNEFELSDFFSRCNKLYIMLPSCCLQEEPFNILSYADEPLSWGDEAQARNIIEMAFDYYSDISCDNKK